MATAPGNKTSPLNPIDAAYIAGLIDGEGTVTLTRKHRNESRSLSVSVSSTELRLLQYLLRTIGVGKITGKRRASSKHRPSYCYAVYNRQALDLLRQTSPYLRSYKRKRARLVLDNYLELTPRNGKYTDELRRRRADFERSVLALKPA